MGTSRWNVRPRGGGGGGGADHGSKDAQRRCHLPRIHAKTATCIRGCVHEDPGLVAGSFRTSEPPVGTRESGSGASSFRLAFHRSSRHSIHLSLSSRPADTPSTSLSVLLRIRRTRSLHAASTATRRPSGAPICLTSHELTSMRPAPAHVSFDPSTGLRPDRVN